MEAEGWYLVPYGLHEERWYSNGTASRPDDLRRADDAETGESDPNYGDAASDSFGTLHTIYDPLRERDRSD